MSIQDAFKIVEQLTNAIAFATLQVHRATAGGWRAVIEGPGRSIRYSGAASESMDLAIISLAASAVYGECHHKRSTPP